MNTQLESVIDSPISAEVRASVKSFIVKSLARDVRDTEEFFQTGMVSSLFGLQLITFLETSFGLRVLDEDLDLANFASIDNILRFIAKKRAVG